jgi:subtilisin family serine protease
MASDEGGRRLHPRLRLIRNGDARVNAVRADATATVVCTLPPTAAVDGVPTAGPLASTADDRAALRASAPSPRARLPRRQKIETQPKADAAFVNVLLELHGDRTGVDAETQQAALDRLQHHLADELRRAGEASVHGAVLQRRNFVAATVPVSMLDTLERDPAVAFVHPAEPLKLDPPVPAPAGTPVARAVGDADTHGRGAGVLIGIIDVGGFDFAHPDFLDRRGRTRFVAIWDQGPGLRPPPAARGFDYGSEITRAHMDAAIVAGRKRGVPPAVLLEPQTQMVPGSHGTHVASIAAGARGVCPEALIACVIVDVPLPEDPVERRRTTFSDTSRIIHAVEYLIHVAAEVKRPLVINISLGTNGGAHDGSNGVARWLDAYLAAPGRAICVAAGNAGQDAAEHDTDLGWMSGRIHAEGRVPSRGLEVELEWTVVGDGIEDLSENELEIWYGAQDRFSVAVQPPGGEWVTVGPREFVENHRLPSGTTLSIYNELYHPTNGANYLAVYLSPNLDPENFRGIQAGVWKVRLIGEEVRDGRFHAWIERDDPREIGRQGSRRLFRFPSFFSLRSNVDSHSISSLACGHRVISVANLDEARQRVHITSSQGPTRDGRSKPELAAPGTAVVAANGFGTKDEPWVAMTGTSMAAPYVSGVVGLMLGANPSLTAAQCAGILLRTARPLPGASYDWGNDVGFGRVNPAAAIEEAAAANARREVRPRKATR